MSYIILLALLALVGLGVYRASQQKAESTRGHREPHLGIGDDYSANEHYPSRSTASLEQCDEGVGPVRYVSSPKAAAKISSTSTKNALNLNDFIIIHVFADPDKPYRGYELLQALLSCSLRYGKRGIFHYHEHVTRGLELFSLASAVEPGTFDLPKISSFSTPGLTLFMQVSAVPNPSEVLSLMLKTARDLSTHLGGEILDSNRNPLNMEQIAAWQNAM